jgi:hypothetical protein
MANQEPDRDPLIERANIERMLRRAGADEQKIAAALRGVEFPAQLSRLDRHLSRLGITREHLIDRMGGSP